MGSSDIRRNFLIGGNWLYYKIYTGTKTSDVFLTQFLKPIVDDLLKKKIILKWFFIRYSDPQYHLRVRFYFENPDDIIILIKELYPIFEEFSKKGMIYKIQTDTYSREIERYGRNAISLSEDLFYHDSVMIVSFLNLIEGDEGEQLRWLFSLRAIDALFNNFKYNLFEKHKMMEKLQDRFGKEFGMSRMLKKQLDHKFRVNREKINSIINLKFDEVPEYNELLNILDEKSKNTIPLVRQIIEFSNKGLLERQLDQLLGSYIHMLMNRLFRSKNRMNEMVCYNFLYRVYRSEIGRNKKVT